jgi:hypothetical protein
MVKKLLFKRCRVGDIGMKFNDKIGMLIEEIIFF